jgi:selenocysteine-specific elongation factor
MTRVVGTAGHIDHGKTTLLRALTGIDADRLPEEKRRGLTIDVGYAHLVTTSGVVLDFVDVPGHDRLVGNMLVGAGEIDSCLLVIAADDGPRAQTLEHLALLDALDVREGVAIVTKADLVPDERLTEVRERVRAVLAPTSLHAVPLLAVSATTGAGIDSLATELARLAAGPLPAEITGGPARLAIDRAFGVRGRGLVVTGSARGAPIAPGDRLRVLPEGGEVRVRGMQVHDREVDSGPVGGRVALLVGGDGVERLRRGQVLVSTAAPEAGTRPPVGTRRLLVTLRRPGVRVAAMDRDDWPPPRDADARLHIGTDQAGAFVIARGRYAVALDEDTMTALVRLERPVAARPGDRFVLRQPPPAGLLAGGVVVDPEPPASRWRDREASGRVVRLATAVLAADGSAIEAAHLDLRGIERTSGGSATGGGSTVLLADDVRDAVERAILDRVAAHHVDDPAAAGIPLTEARDAGATTLRKLVGARVKDAADGADLVIGDLVASGKLRRDGDVVAVAGRRPATPDPARAAAMERLLAALDVVAPPPLRAAASEAGCPPDGLRELEREGRVILVDDDLAWTLASWERLRDMAVELARARPLTPAALRDATGTSRKYVMALLEDLQRRGILTRTAAGHVPGPRA